MVLRAKLRLRTLLSALTHAICQVPEASHLHVYVLVQVLSELKL
jgi:hypothetical protein